jgi:mannose-6-phosphate isomerase-like protein (cupin superfamily)
MKVKYDLRKSMELLGELYPILLDASGKYIIDGYHRIQTNPHWKRLKLENIKDMRQILVARIVSNLCRRNVPTIERISMFEKLAEYLKSNEGCPPNKIATEIARLTGISYRTVCRYLPEAYKDRDKVQLSKLKRDKLKNYKMIVDLNEISSYEIHSPHAQKLKVVLAPNRTQQKLATVIETSILPGNSTPLHIHSESNEYAYVISGNGKLIIGSEEVSFKENTVLLTPMKVPHQYCNDTVEYLKIIYFYIPPLNLKRELTFYEALKAKLPA